MFGDWLEGITELSRALHSADLDLASFASLCALSLVNGKSNDLEYIIFNNDLEQN